MEFHHNTGSSISLSSDRKTASRKSFTFSFSDAIVICAKPLKMDQVFYVLTKKKEKIWLGSVVVGVTSVPPAGMLVPSDHTKMPNDTWVMSGRNVYHNHMKCFRHYGESLDQLKTDSIVGVKRTSAGKLHFFINGRDLGPAADLPPSPLYAFVDVFGRCYSVTIVDPCQLPSNTGDQLSSEIGALSLQAQPPLDIPRNPTHLAESEIAATVAEETEDVVEAHQGGLEGALRELELSDELLTHLRDKQALTSSQAAQIKEKVERGRSREGVNLLISTLTTGSASSVRHLISALKTSGQSHIVSRLLEAMTRK